VNLGVKIEPEAHSDLGNLTPALLQEAYSLIVKLKSQPLRGGELGPQPEVGDLTGCRRLYFNKGRHRVIYQLLPNDKQPKLVRVLAVGRRANLGVYRDVAWRLGRTPGV
jgi:hypothetical protein